MNRRRAYLPLFCLALLAPAAHAQEQRTGRTTSGQFSVGPTGQASYHIPLELPPGTAGHAPQLALAYSSGGANGLAGVGWTLSGLPEITRCAPALLGEGGRQSVNGTQDDIFCLDGEPLVRTGGDYFGESHYRTLREGWSRVIARSALPGVTSLGPAWFEVTTRDGTRLELGKTDDSRVRATRTEAGMTGDVGFTFGVNRITDRHGNTIDVRYRRSGNVLHPERITYGGRRVQLYYEASYRPDRPLRFIAGMETRRDHRLWQIVTFLDPAGPGSPSSAQVVKRYRLAYTPSPSTGASLLASVTECDSAGTCFAPVRLTYQSPQFDGTFDPIYPSGTIFQDDLRFDPGARIVPGDFNGDGMTDFIRQERAGWDDDDNNTANTYLSTGRSGFERRTITRAKYLKNEHVVIIVGDYDGDGRDDFIAQHHKRERTDYQLYISRGDGDFDHVTLNGGTRMAAEHARLIPGDFNGDGRTDFLHQEIGEWGKSDGYIAIYYSEGRSFRRVRYADTYNLDANKVTITAGDFDGDGRADFIAQQPWDTRRRWDAYYAGGEGEFERVIHTDWNLDPDGTNLIVGDYNGDGLLDFIRQEKGDLDSDYSSSFMVFFSMGRSFHWERPGFPLRYDPYQDYGRFDPGAELMPGDFNGDGITDLLRRERRDRQNDNQLTFQIMLSAGDGTFTFYTPAGELYQRGLREDLGCNIIVGDFDGDGQSDFIRQEKGEWDDDQNTSFGVFRNVDPRPDFLTQIDESSGRRTTITYAPVTRSWVYGSGLPGERPGIPLGSPMYVVTRYMQLDAFRAGPERNVAFTYGDGRVFTDGRGFLGFRKVYEFDYHSDTRTNTFYEQAWPFNSFPTRTAIRRHSEDELVKAIDTVYTVTHPVADNYLLGIASVEVTHAEAGAQYRTRKEYHHDDYGNVALEVDLGLTDYAGDDVATCTVYANDPATWQLGLATAVVEAASCTTSCACTGVLSRQRNEYDERGRLVRSEAYESEVDRWIGETIAYDDVGNVIRRTNPAGAIIEQTFDAAYRTFPTAEVADAAGAQLTTVYEFSPAFGVLLREVKPDGSVFRREIDGFGRTIRTYGPGPSGEVLLGETSRDDDPADRYEEVKSLAAYGEARFITTKTYFDAFDRPYRVETREAPGSVPVVVTTAYDGEGRVLSESQPHYAGEAAPVIAYEYDAAARIVRATLPNGATQEAEYALSSGACAGCVLQRTVIENRGAPEERRIVHHLDARGQVRVREHAGGMVQRYAYDLAGRVTQYQDPKVTTTTAYDSLGRVKSVTSPDTGTTWYAYDDAGRVSTTGDALDHGVTFEYDAMNRVLEKQFSDGRRLLLTYDDPALAGAAGRLASAAVEENGVVRSRFAYTYDAYGHVTSKAITYDGTTYTLSMTYGPDGQPTSLTYPDGSVLVHAYDGLNRLASLRLDGVTYATYQDYTALGAPRAVHYANGVDATFEYASHGVLERNLIVGPGDGTPRTLLDQELEHDLRMQVTRIVDNVRLHEQEMLYDARGFLTEVRSPVFGTRTYGYDAAGNLTSRDGVTQTYAGHRVVSDSNGAVYQYDAAGNRTSTLRDGVVSTYSYDHARRLTSVVRNGQAVGSYEYDPEGMRIRKTDADGVDTIYLTPQYEITKFPDGRTLHTRYVFDHTGRVAAVTRNGTEAEPLIAQRQATLAALSSGAGGGASAAKATAGAWLPSLPSPAMLALVALALVGLWFLAVAFARRAPRTDFMRRAPRMVPMVPVVLATFLTAVVPGCGRGPGTGAAANGELENGDLELGDVGAVLDPGVNGYGYPFEGTFFFHQDRVGSTSIVTDALGRAVSELVYLPYGEIYEPASVGFDIFRSKFGDKELDRDAGLYYFDARYYDPVAGRFLTADSYLVGGDPELPGVLNRYQFAGNNPIVHADPTGNLVLTLIIIGAIMGGYFAGVEANGGNFNLTKWNWDAKTIGLVFMGAVLGGLSGGVSFGAAMGIAAAESVVSSLVMGQRGVDVLKNLAIDLSLGVGAKGVGKITKPQRNIMRAATRSNRQSITRGADGAIQKPTLRQRGARALSRAGEGAFDLVDGVAELATSNAMLFVEGVSVEAQTQEGVAVAMPAAPLVRLSSVRSEIDPAALVRPGAGDLGLVLASPRGQSFCLVCRLGAPEDQPAR